MENKIMVETKTFTHVTDLDLNSESVYHVMTGGRTRWKCENETFNTLKNRGYGMNHNYGHGKENLSMNTLLMMFLAFFIDQIFEIKNKLFNTAHKAYKYKSYLWEAMKYAYMW